MTTDISQQCANDYALKLISDEDTLRAYCDEIAMINTHALQYLKVNSESEEKIQSIINLGLDYFFQPKGFTVEQLVKAQKMLSAYHLHYWTGTYYTQLKNKRTNEIINKGKIFTVAAGEFIEDAPRISYSKDSFIGLSLFKNLALNWTGLGIGSSGDITFTLLTNNFTGKVSKALSGSYTDKNGVEYQLSGFEYEPSQVSLNSIPADTNMDKIKNASKVVNYLAISTFMMINLVQTCKFGKIGLAAIRAKLQVNKEAFLKQGDTPSKKEIHFLIPQGEISLPANLSFNPSTLTNDEVKQIGKLRDEVESNLEINNTKKKV